MQKKDENIEKNKTPTCIRWPILHQKVVKKTIVTMVSIIWAVAFTLFFFSSIIIQILGSNATIGLLMLSFGLCAISIYSYEQLHFNRYFYDLQNDYLVIKEGVFTYGETTLPYSRIQDVYVDQDVFDQLFGLYDLHISTASGQSSLTAHIDGLSYESSENIKRQILDYMKTGSGHEYKRSISKNRD